MLEEGRAEEVNIHITRFDSDLNIKIELTTSKYKTYTCGRLVLE
jgi:hypothetical protein